MVRRLGPYSLLRQIASGGMAEVYLASARSDEVERRVALKLIHAHSADDPELVSMLVEEARLALQLQHPNIVATYDLGHEGGEYYIVMELVEGMDLFRALQRAAERDIDFPFELGAFIAREVASGLDYAHRRLDQKGQPLHVVHRDVSPHNVLLSYGGEVKLGDFGIAKAARRAAQTQAGVIKGKYAYMSPEQAWGDPIDARTDIFSAGILLYEMLAGQMLYLEEELERLLELVRKAEIAPPGTRRKGVPRDLEQIVMKALRRRPSDRYTTAGDYAQALADFLRGYAPTFNGPQQLGAFLERLAGPKEPNRRRGADEPTAALPRPRSFGGPLVQDQNSLLFPSSAQTDLAGEDDEFGGATYVDEGPAALRGLLGAPRAGARLDEEDRLGSEPTALVDALPTVAPAAPAPTRAPPAPARPAATSARPTPAPAPTRATPAQARPGTGTAPAPARATPATARPTPAPAQPGAPSPATTRAAPARPAAPSPTTARATPAPAQPAAPSPTTARATPAPAQPGAPAAPRPVSPSGAIAPRLTPAPSRARGPEAGAAGDLPTASAKGSPPREPSPIGATPTQSPPSLEPRPERPREPMASEPVRVPTAAPEPPQQPSVAQQRSLPPDAPAAPPPPNPQPAAAASAPPRDMASAPAAPRPAATASAPPRDTASAPPLPPERLQRGRGGLVLGFLAAMALGAGGVLAVVLWPTAPARGQLEVRSAPSGATVLIDGRAVDAPTPVRIFDLARDRAHRVTVRMPGYRTWEDEVRFQGGEQSRAVQAVLEKQ